MELFMSISDVSSSYDLLASYSTAANLQNTATASGSTDDFIKSVQEVLSEAEELLESSDLTNYYGASAIDDSDEGDGEEEDSSTGSSGSVSDSGSTYFRPDDSDPLEPDDMPSDELTFMDMLQLMIVQFQNQTMDDTASTTDMMNQLVQMTTMQAMTSMEESITEMTATNEMLYTSSLVGKEVTVGYFQEDGSFVEEVGVVAGAGYYGGLPVIFLEGKETFFYTSDIMAVGRLPDTTVEDPEDDGSSDDVGAGDGVGDSTGDDVGTGDSVEGSTDNDVETDENEEAADISMLGFNYVDYSQLSAEELLEASKTALG